MLQRKSVKNSELTKKKRKKSGMSPTARTIAYLQKVGIRCAVVEKWIPMANIRRDLFNIIDIIALDHARGVLGIQVTSGSTASHIKKIIRTHAQETLDWLSTPGTVLEVWGWSKRKKVRGGVAYVWTPKVSEITEKDIK